MTPNATAGTLKGLGPRLVRWWRVGGRLTVQLVAGMAALGAVIAILLAVLAPDVDRLRWSLILIWLLPSLTFLALKARRGVLERVAPLPISRAAGRATRWMRARAIQSLLWVAVVVVAVWLVDVFGGDPLRAPKVSWAEVGRVLALLAVLLALLMTLRARRGMVVEEIVDYTTDLPMTDSPMTGSPTRTRGVAQLLVHELDYLAELHRAVDEQRVVGTAVGRAAAIGASISVDGDSDFLRKDLSAEAQLRVGPMSVPVRAVAAVFGRVARGPRLTGSLHHHGDVLALTARTSGLRPAYGWQVQRRVPAEAADTTLADTVKKMADEMACRVFTDLALSRTVRWTATRCFAQGLTAYRDSLQTERDRAYKLRQAERKFLEAVSEDRNFDLAYHNLGVVFIARNRLPAAERAFKMAIDINPQRLEAYYALALVDRARQDDHSAVRRCERILHGKPDHEQAAAAQDLIGLLHLDQEVPAKAVVWARKAARRARKVLRRRYLTPWLDEGGRALGRVEQNLAVYLHHLAIAHVLLVSDEVNWRGWWHGERARALLRNSIRLWPAWASAHLALGRSLPSSDDEAAQALRMATQLAPKDSASWAALAVALAERGEADEAGAACRQALANPRQIAEIDPSALEQAARAYEVLGDEQQAKRVRAMPSIIAELPSPTDLEAMAAVEKELEQPEKELEQPNWGGRGWERAQLLLLLESQPSVELDKAGRWLEEAITLLEEDHADEEIRSRGLQGRFARVLLMQREHASALSRAEHALDLDPTNAYERSIIGSVYAELSELQAARGAFEEALLQQPEQPDVQLQLAYVLVDLADNCQDTAKRDRLLGEAQDYAERALTFFHAEDTGRKSNTRVFLASIAQARRRYDDAVAHCLVAHNLDPTRVTPILMLGESFRRKRAFTAAARSYAAAIEIVRQPGGRQHDDDPRADSTLADVVDSFNGIAIRRGEVLTQAYLGLAELRFDRHLDPSEGRALARAARRHLASSGLQGDERDRWEAQCLASVAWSHILEGKLEAGLRGLERAAARQSDPQLYLRWALALEMQAELVGPNARGPYARARECAALARQLDVGGLHRQAIDALLQRLEDSSAK